jgi:ATP-dependent DNA ligase
VGRLRAIAEVEQGSVRLYSRNRLSLTERFRLIANSLSRLGHDAVLDGEVVVLDEHGKAQFQLLQNRGRSGAGVLAYYWSTSELFVAAAINLLVHCQSLRSVRLRGRPRGQGDW